MYGAETGSAAAQNEGRRERERVGEREAERERERESDTGHLGLIPQRSSGNLCVTHTAGT